MSCPIIPSMSQVVIPSILSRILFISYNLAPGNFPELVFKFLPCLRLMLVKLLIRSDLHNSFTMPLVIWFCSQLIRLLGVLQQKFLIILVSVLMFTSSCSILLYNFVNFLFFYSILLFQLLVLFTYLNRCILWVSLILVNYNKSVFFAIITVLHIFTETLFIFVCYAVSLMPFYHCFDNFLFTESITLWGSF